MSDQTYTPSGFRLELRALVRDVLSGALPLWELPAFLWFCLTHPNHSRE